MIASLRATTDRAGCRPRLVRSGCRPRSSRSRDVRRLRPSNEDQRCGAHRRAPIDGIPRSGGTGSPQPAPESTTSMAPATPATRIAPSADRPPDQVAAAAPRAIPTPFERLPSQIGGSTGSSGALFLLRVSPLKRFIRLLLRRGAEQAVCHSRRRHDDATARPRERVAAQSRRCATAGAEVVVDCRCAHATGTGAWRSSAHVGILLCVTPDSVSEPVQRLELARGRHDRGELHLPEPERYDDPVRPEQRPRDVLCGAVLVIRRFRPAIFALTTEQGDSRRRALSADRATGGSAPCEGRHGVHERRAPQRWACCRSGSRVEGTCPRDEKCPAQVALRS
jgi:hypothetical protein